MYHIIDDATSAMHDAYDDTTSLLDNIVRLGEFIVEQLARAREIENTESDDTEKVMMKNHLLHLRVMFLIKKFL